MPNEMTTLGDGAMAYLSKFGEGMRGTFLKFSKEGKFIKTMDAEIVPEGTECVCVYDQTQAGWIKFHGKGVDPERKMGPIFAGYVPPPREELGDQDDTLWEIGLNGKPQDPWQHQMLLPLQDTKTGELYVFATSSQTGRRAVNALLYSCQGMLKKDPKNYPVVKLTAASFKHKDPRVGAVNVPQFVIVGNAPRDDYAAAATGTADHMDDEIPF